MQAAASRRARPGSSGVVSRNTAGIIRYVDPLAAPLATNSTRKLIRNAVKLPDFTDTIAARMPSPITTNEQTVIHAPPTRSASLPPNGRATDPTSAPRNAKCAGVTSGNVVLISSGNAAPKPMNDPNVPMYRNEITQVCGRFAAAIDVRNEEF